MISRIRYYHNLIKGRPLRQVVSKGASHIARSGLEKASGYRDLLAGSYEDAVPLKDGTLTRILVAPETDLLLPYAGTVQKLSKLYLEHKFEILGSGWIDCSYRSESQGILGVRYSNDLPGSPSVNRSNRVRASKIAALLSRDYCRIDWQRDFKSGYRWDESTPSARILYGHLKGVDIKVPWELARMQHLPALVWAALLARAGVEGFNAPERYICEIKDQIIDFISSNPPRFGVNWRCTMDVGIRLANWLVVYDLVRAAGFSFGSEFDEVFTVSIYEHALHCVNHLEYTPKLRSNHYLADIAGLAFASVYLPPSEQADAWYAFSVQEILSEMEHEFHEDGSNFEASTSYHRLSVEMMGYTAIFLAAGFNKRWPHILSYDPALIKKQPELKPGVFANAESSITPGTPFPEWFWTRLEKSIEFTSDVMKEDNSVIQIGDNDSGRFFKLFPMFGEMTVGEAKAKYANLSSYNGLSDDEIYLDERILDHRHVLAFGAGIFGRSEWSQSQSCELLLEQSFSKALRSTVEPPSLAPNARNQAAKVKVAAREPMDESSELIPLLHGNRSVRDRRSFAYPYFGIFGWVAPGFKLVIRCGSIGQNGNGGHAHNDQLSVNLFVNGKDLYADPGTFIYTPFPEERQRFRSVDAHPTVWPSEWGEQNDITATFAMRPWCTTEVLRFDESGLTARVVKGGKQAYLRVIFKDDDILINRPIRSPEFFSNGYGRLLN